MGQSMHFTPAKVRIKITMDDGTTHVLRLDGPGILMALGIEMHSREVPSTSCWVEREPTGCATIKLEATGKLGKSERRAARAEDARMSA